MFLCFFQMLSRSLWPFLQMGPDGAYGLTVYSMHQLRLTGIPYHTNVNHRGTLLVRRPQSQNGNRLVYSVPLAQLFLNATCHVAFRPVSHVDKRHTDVFVNSTRVKTSVSGGIGCGGEGRQLQVRPISDQDVGKGWRCSGLGPAGEAGKVGEAVEVGTPSLGGDGCGSGPRGGFEARRDPTMKAPARGRSGGAAEPRRGTGLYQLTYNIPMCNSSVPRERRSFPRWEMVHFCTRG